MDLDWTLLRSFLAIYDGGSLTAAATQLGQSQPTLGRHLQTLEASLGAPLFLRKPRGQEPTALAHQLSDVARRMQTAALDVQMLADNQEQSIQGTVRVTASEVVATYILPPILHQILQENPQVQIELVASNTADNLLMREADIAVRMAPPTQDDVIAKKIGDVPIGLFAHKDYLTRNGTPQSWDDMMTHTVVGYDKTPLMIDALTAMGIPASPASFRLRCDDQAAHVEFLRMGLGIVATQKGAVRHLNNITQILPQLPLPPLPMYLAAHKQLRSVPRIRLVFDALVEGLA